MPNHIQNKITIDCNNERREEILREIQYDYDIEYLDSTGYGTFDFNKLIPMPQEYEDGDRWYGWRCQHWGTKWNSYENNVNFIGGLLFRTAWAAPHPVIEELARRYPDVEFVHEYADEDIGSNCGRRVYENGECVEEWKPNDCTEAIEFAASIWGETPESLGYCLDENGQYRYVDM